jgi:hypothetical protein
MLPRFDPAEIKGCPNMPNTALSAFAFAWTTTIIATTLLVAALALSQVWDSTIFLRSLQGVLNLDV